MRRVATAALAMSLLIAGCGKAHHSHVAAPVQTTSSTKTTGSKYTHVVNIWMENKGSASIIGSKDAPYENQLADTYGLATNFVNIAHPSLPNYIAATSGSTQGIKDDGAPSENARNVDSLFGQFDAAHETWKSYEESMSQNCQQSSSGEYAVKHNPAAYYTPLHDSCMKNDVPLGATNAGAFAYDLNVGLPNFAFIAPNLTDDTHNSSVATGDAWLQQWIPKIMSSRDYALGDTIIIVSWDEIEGSGKTQAEIVISPTTRNVKSSILFNHYSRLSAIEELFGFTQLRPGENGDAYLKAFGLQ